LGQARGIDGREQFDGRAEGLRIDEVESRGGPHEDEREAPESYGAVQVPVHALPADAAAHCQVAPPIGNAGPPHDQACQAQERGQPAADGVHVHAVRAQQEIAVQVRNPAHDTEIRRNCGAQIFSCVGIHQAPHLAGAAFEQDFGGFVAIASRLQIADRVAGINSLQGSFQFTLVKRMGLWRYVELVDQHVVNVVAEDYGAAADADDGDV